MAERFRYGHINGRLVTITGSDDDATAIPVEGELTLQGSVNTDAYKVEVSQPDKMRVIRLGDVVEIRRDGVNDRLQPVRVEIEGKVGNFFIVLP